MNKKNMDRGFKIQQELSAVESNLNDWRDKKENPTMRDLSWSGAGISKKASEEIRTIAINSLVSRRRSLKHEFSKL